MASNEAAGRRIVALVGQERWSKVLAQGLRGADFETRVVPVSGGANLLNPRLWRVLRNSDLILRVGFRPGARTIRGHVFDVLLGLVTRRSAQRVMYWIGTDVANHISDERRYGHTALDEHVDDHLAGSEPLLAELADAGIRAQLMDFPSFVARPAGALPAMPEDFTVVTYIPDGRADFYGGPQILELAREFPQVQFSVMGGSGRWIDGGEAPANLEFLGWVTDPGALYSRSSAVIRIPEHDSLGATAAEGVLFGRPVLYTQAMPFVRQVTRDVGVLKTELADLVEQHESGRLQPDQAAADWARVFFDPERRFLVLRSWLESKLNQSPSGC